MNTKTALIAAILTTGGFVAIGCDDKGTTTTETKTTETTGTGTSSGDKVADKANAAAHNVADAARDLGHKVADTARDNNMTPSTTMPADSTADAGVVATVTEYYNKATAAIQSGKLDDAQGYIDKLKTYRDKAPAEWQSKIDQLVSTFNSAKARLNSLPGVNNMPH